MFSTPSDLSSWHSSDESQRVYVVYGNDDLELEKTYSDQNGRLLSLQIEHGFLWPKRVATYSYPEGQLWQINIYFKKDDCPTTFDNEGGIIGHDCGEAHE